MAWSVSQLKEAFKILGHEGTNSILVGGQAVNVWCEYYEKKGFVEQTAWDKLKPFTSADLDVYGSSLDAEDASKQFETVRLDVYDPFRRTASPEAAALEVNFKDKRLIIHFLHSIRGVGHDELERTAIELTTGKDKIRVIHPFLSLEARVETIQNRRDEPGHQDLPHLQRTIAVVKSLLIDQLQKGNHRAFLHGAERVFRLARRQEGLLVAVQDNITIEQSIPLAAARQYPELEKFCVTRVPQLLAILSKDRQRMARKYAKRKGLPKPNPQKPRTPPL